MNKHFDIVKIKLNLANTDMCRCLTLAVRERYYKKYKKMTQVLALQYIALDTHELCKDLLILKKV